MNENILSANISRLRKDSGLTQDALASRLGVTYQAVSKWENGASCPDVMLLPEIANIFNVSIDELFGRAGTEFESFSATSDKLSCIPGDVPWDNDNTLRIAIYNGTELLTTLDETSADKFGHIPFVYNGPALNISSALTVHCKNCSVGGNITAGGNVYCCDVEGSINAAGNVECADVGCDVSAQGNVQCADVGGNLNAGGNVSCGDISASASAGGEMDCGDVYGNAHAGGDLSCTEVYGSASASGDISADEVHGNAEAGGDIRCGNVGGDVRASGSVKCGDISGSIYCSEVSSGVQRADGFGFECEFDAEEFKASVGDFARKAEKVAKKTVNKSVSIAEKVAKDAINLSANIIDQISAGVFGRSKAGDTQSDAVADTDCEIAEGSASTEDDTCSE